MAAIARKQVDAAGLGGRAPRLVWDVSDSLATTVAACPDGSTDKAAADCLLQYVSENQQERERERGKERGGGETHIRKDRSETDRDRDRKGTEAASARVQKEPSLLNIASDDTLAIVVLSNICPLAP